MHRSCTQTPYRDVEQAAVVVWRRLQLVLARQRRVRLRRLRDGGRPFVDRHHGSRNHIDKKKILNLFIGAPPTHDKRLWRRRRRFADTRSSSSSSDRCVGDRP
jgi:hypothetical protein